MTSYYLKQGDVYKVINSKAIDIHDDLPVGTYTVGQDPMTGEFFLKSVEDFNLSGKVYGDANKTADRIFRTFQARDNSTGCLLVGEKGSGKTMTAKRLSIIARNEFNYPTILINQPLCGEGFNTFIQRINTPAVVIFDEFEKVYDSDDQESMLTLLDGTYPSKKLFVLTCNDKYRIDRHMNNRPGRVFYSIEYKGIAAEFIREYCNDQLKDELKAHIEDIVNLSLMFRAFNFDMLKAIVEDMNRYNETPREVVQYLNCRPDTDSSQQFKVDSFVYNGVVLEVSDTIEMDLFSEQTRIGGYDRVNLDEDGDARYRCAFIGRSNLKKILPNGQFVYSGEHRGDPWSLIITKMPPTHYSYFDV